MDRAEAAGVGVAVLGHVALFALLSLSLFGKPPLQPVNDPVEVQLVDEVGLRSAAPKAETPAPSFAPEIAPPEDIAPAAPVAPAPEVKTKVKPAPTPSPAPAPIPAPTQVKSKPKIVNLAATLGLATVAAHALAKHAEKTPKGAQLGDLFKDGAGTKSSSSMSKTPAAATIDGKAIASISDALRRQVQPCADRALNPGPGASDIITKLNLHFNKDGSFAVAPVMVSQSGIDDDNHRYAQRVRELAVAAYMQCAPYHLPPELYADSANRGWNNISAVFKLRPGTQ